MPVLTFDVKVLPWLERNCTSALAIIDAKVTFSGHVRTETKPLN